MLSTFRIFLAHVIVILLITASCTEKSSNNSSLSDSTSIAGLSKLIRSNPKNAELFHLRSRANYNAGIYLDAIKDVEIAIKLDSLVPNYRFSQAEYYLKTGESKKSFTILKDATSRFPSEPQSFLKLSELLLFVQDYKASMEQLIKVQELSPSLPDVYFLKGLIYKEMRDSIRAKTNFQQCIDKDPDFYKAYIEMGLLFGRQRNSLAIDYFNTAINLRPRSIEAYYNLGMFYQENSRFPEAIKTYQLIIDTVDVNYVEAYYNIGYIYLEKIVKPKEAVIWFTKAIELKSNYYQAYYNRGYAWEKEGDFEKARLDYQKSMQILPNYNLAIGGLNRLDEKMRRK